MKESTDPYLIGRKQVVIDSDGTMYVTDYNREGNIIHQWKEVPDLANKDSVYIYVWDEKAQEWRLDQDQNGIPDEKEESSSGQFFV